jgi:CubicO group peptidase (beta-lactamase class C family)
MTVPSSAPRRAGRRTGAAESLARAVGAGSVPGAVFAAGVGAQVDDVVVVGDAQHLGGPVRPMRRDTLFDLASLTKVVATTPSILLLAGAGRLSLEDLVCAYSPDFVGDGREQVTIRQLLSHTSGLPREVRFWQTMSDPALARQALHRMPLESAPGSRVEYSDVGFMLLGEVVEAVSGATLDATVSELVTCPLDMGSTCFNPGKPYWRRAAATEPGLDGVPIVGVVHDENARFFGGVMGHAGLFSTVDDLVRYVGAWLDGGPEASALYDWRVEACRDQTAGLNGRRGLGWVLRGDPMDFLTDSWPLTSVSHTGFTGTSIAFDPESKYWAVLLTNAVHFGRSRERNRGLRQEVYSVCGPLAA